jgi:hypothetical protein
MECIGPDPVALRQKGMCSRVHGSITSRSLRIRAQQIRHPPGGERTVACQSVCDPQPPKDPAWIASAKIKSRGRKSDDNRSEINQRGDQKFASGEFYSDTSYVVECPQRNPIVECHEQHDKTLERKQRYHGDGMHKLAIITLCAPPERGLTGNDWTEAITAYQSRTSAAKALGPSGAYIPGSHP